MKILITGANGFVGNALIERLLSAGHEITALVRNKDKIKNLSKKVHWLEGDILNPKSLPHIKKLDTAFFLIHGLKEVSDKFENLEAVAAVNFVNWIRPTGAKLVYLGGLAPEGVNLSPHLRSRHLTGAILGSSGIPTLEFRASIVLGENSLSFEMIKALSERLPFRPQMELLNQPCQPIALNDLLNYLEASLTFENDGYRIFEIAGPDIATYGELLDTYIELSGLKRKKIKVPEVELKVLLKGLEYSLPEYANAGRKLAESLEFPTVMKDDSALKAFPEINPQPLRVAMDLARNASQTHYAPLWEKDFLRVLLSDKLLTQSGLLSPDLLKNLEKIGKLKDILTKR
jgi:uncharacterized protein YbjT (DUF2867 family)